MNAAGGGMGQAPRYGQPGTNIYDPTGVTSGRAVANDGGDSSLFYVPDTQRYNVEGQKQIMQERDRLDAGAESRHLAQLPASMSAIFGTGGSSPQPAVTYGGPQMTAAQDAAFARAKDRAGSMARSATTAVHEDAAARGVAGSGFEAGDVARRAIAPSMNVLGDINARQMAEAYNAASNQADVTYRGDIEQRGQDQNLKLASMEALMTALRGWK